MVGHLGDDVALVVHPHRHVVGDVARGDHHAGGVDALVADQALERAGRVDDLPGDGVLVVRLLQLGAALHRVLEPDADGALRDELGDAVHLAEVCPSTRPESRTTARARSLPNVPMRATALRAVLLGDVGHHRSRPATEKSESMSGIDLRPGLRKRSNSRSWASGSRSTIRSAYATSDPAAEPRPGPDADAVLARPAHVVPHDQEVAGEAHLGDDAEFEPEPLLRGGRPAAGVSPLQALAAEPLQVGLCRLAARHREARQLDVAERQVERRAALRDLQRRRERVHEVRQRGGHLRAGLEVELLRLEPEPLGVAQQVARLDGQEGLVRVGVRPARVVRVARRHQRQPGVHGQRAQAGVDAGLDLQPRVLDLHVDVVAPEDLGQRVELGARGRLVVALQAGADDAGEASGEGDDAVGVPRHELVRDARLAVVALEVAGRAELDEVVVALGGLGEQRQVVAPFAARPLGVVGDHVGLEADHRRDPARRGLAVQLDGAAHDAVVRQRDRRLPHPLHDVQQPVDLAGPVEHRVVRVDVEVDEGRVGGRHGALRVAYGGWPDKTRQR